MVSLRACYTLCPPILHSTNVHWKENLHILLKNLGAAVCIEGDAVFIIIDPGMVQYIFQSTSSDICT